MDIRNKNVFFHFDTGRIPWKTKSKPLWKPCGRQRDLGLTLGGVAVLTSTQMVLTNVAAPFWGIIADRGLLQRRSILTLGCLGDAWNGGQWPFLGWRICDGASDMIKPDRQMIHTCTHYIIYDMYITYEKIGVIYVCICIWLYMYTHTYVCGGGTNQNGVVYGIEANSKRGVNR